MIETKTLHTKKMFNDYATYIVNKRMKYMICIYICSAIVSVCGIIMMVCKEYFQGALYLFLGLFFALYGVLMRYIISLSNKKNVNSVNIFEFEDTKFTITNMNKEGKEIGKSIINYDTLHSVVLYKNYAYIFVNKLTSYIISKENFENEEQFYSLVQIIKSKISSLNFGDNNATVEDALNGNSLENSETKTNEEETKISKTNNENAEEENKKLENEENEIIAKIKVKNANKKK